MGHPISELSAATESHVTSRIIPPSFDTMCRPSKWWRREPRRMLCCIVFHKEKEGPVRSACGVAKLVYARLMTSCCVKLDLLLTWTTRPFSVVHGLWLFAMSLKNTRATLVQWKEEESHCVGSIVLVAQIIRWRFLDAWLIQMCKEGLDWSGNPLSQKYDGQQKGLNMNEIASSLSSIVLWLFRLQGSRRSHTHLGVTRTKEWEIWGSCPHHRVYCYATELL